MAPIVIKVFVPFYSRLNLYTAYEYLERRFSLPVRVLTSVLFQVLRGAHVAIVIYAPSLVINLVTGLPVWQCILFIGGFTTFYTTLGGMKAVIWTDVIQFGAVSSGICSDLYKGVRHRSRGRCGAVSRPPLAAGKLDLINLAADPTQLTPSGRFFSAGSSCRWRPVPTDQADHPRGSSRPSQPRIAASPSSSSPDHRALSTMLYLAGVAI